MSYISSLPLSLLLALPFSRFLFLSLSFSLSIYMYYIYIRLFLSLSLTYSHTDAYTHTNQSQTGVSRHLFERWCDDERNGVVLAGYTVEGTLAHDLLNHPTEIVCQDNRVKVRRCQIEFISFSAHVDYTQNSAFIRTVRVKVIVIMKIIHQFLMSHMFSSVIFLSTPSFPRFFL